jgi:hypothetical protein
MYAHFPKWFPIAVSALSIFSFFFFLQAFGWIYGILLTVMMHFSSDLLCQKYILRASSRSSCGFAWGVTVSATWAYYEFVSQHMNVFWDVLIAISVVCIVYTLLKSMFTSPQTLRNEGDETSNHTIASKMLESGLILDTSGRAVDITFRLCPTCLVDKSLASTHCVQCDHCAVNLDHHCPFVNNCVGKGNRRMFVLFTFFAGFGCELMALLSFYAEHYFYCVEAKGMVSD